MEARTWKGVFKKLIEIARSKFGKHPASSTSSPVDYASVTNYPKALAYETNYAGKKYWKLITDLIEKFGMLKGDNRRDTINQQV